MRYLIKFNESFGDDVKDDISDMFLELGDDGFKVSIMPGVSPKLNVTKPSYNTKNPILINIYKPDTRPYHTLSNFVMGDIYEYIERLYNYYKSNFNISVKIIIAGDDWNYRLQKTFPNLSDWEWSKTKDMFMNGYQLRDGLTINKKTLISTLLITMVEIKL